MKTPKRQPIVLDGPAGSGKSTIAKSVASALDGAHYLDSGAFYRALTVGLLGEWRQNPEKNFGDWILEFSTSVECQAFLRNQTLSCEFSSKDENRILWNSRDITKEIRDPETTSQIRFVADKGVFRDFVNTRLRELSESVFLVMDGRDLGTVVFPDSPHKFFITASLQVRAERRQKDLEAQGFPSDLKQLIEDIRLRDHTDETREIAPLKQAKGSILIDTSGLSLKTVLDTVLSRLRPTNLQSNAQVKLNPTTPSNKKNTPTASFAEVFSQWEESNQESDSSFTKGQLIEGTVVDTVADTVFVDIGEKLEARVPREEFHEIPKPGTPLTLATRRRVDGYWILSKKDADQRQGWETIRESYQSGYPVVGRVVSEVKGKGFQVDVEGVTLFLPASQLAIKYKDLDELKSKDLDIKIIEINERNKTGVVSRKKLLDEVNNEKWDALIEKVKVGDKVNATVSKIANFGVFLNVHDVIGLLRQNDISYKKYAPFKHYFQVGQEMEVVILGIDKENNKLSLGLKQLFEDPWDWAKRELEKEMVIRGVVTSLTNFGAFVELKEGLEGLIHNSELTWSKKPPNPKELLKKGEEVEAMILDIDFENRRLSLGLKQLQANPWDSLSSNVRVGNVLEGKVTGITKYGAFVEVENGIEGLIHITDLSWDEKEKNPNVFVKKGDSIQYKILDVNTDAQRISCGLKQLTEHPYEALRKKYPPGTLVDGKIKSIVAFGIFVEIEPGYEGLVHISEIPDGKHINLSERFVAGEPVQTVVVKIDPNAKKISLSIKDFDKAIEREEMAKYVKQDNEPSTSSMGSFFNRK